MNQDNPEATMPVSQAALTKWAAACDQAGDNAAMAAAMLHEGDVVRAREFMDEARAACRRVHLALIDAGAERIEPASGVPLHLLSTPATRRLLSSLRAAVDAAEAVDAERGHMLPDSVPLQPGESRGTGWAEAISNLAERLRVEVEGPRGRGE